VVTIGGTEPRLSAFGLPAPACANGRQAEDRQAQAGHYVVMIA